MLEKPRICDLVSSGYRCRLVWIYKLAKPAATHGSGEQMCCKGTQNQVPCFPLAALCSHITGEYVILWSTEQPRFGSLEPGAGKGPLCAL